MDAGDIGSRADTEISLSRSGPDAIAVRVIRLYLDFALRTTRWRIEGHPDARALLTRSPAQADAGAVVAFWHQILPLTPALWSWARAIEPTLSLRVLISRNRDGRLISDIVAPWDIIGIAGSTSRRGKDKGGAQALRQATRALQAGMLVAITPDGPRGPLHHAQPGTLALARLGHRKIVPVGGAASGWRLGSWDCMVLPRPFGRGIFVCGQPLDDGCDLAALETALKSTSEAALHRHRVATRRLQDRAWAAFGTVAAPFLIALVQRRIARGREIRSRRRERLGFAAFPRPDGRLIWLHAASVGEAISLRPLLDALVAADPARTIVVTTATVTGADIIESHARAHAGSIVHQFIPFDVPRWIGRFLDHWRPAAAILAESEIWPGLLGECRTRGIPVAIVNGRMSERSWSHWTRLGRMTSAFFGDLAWVAARGPEDATRFRALGAREVLELGDLKKAAPPLAADPDELAELRALLADRPVWLCAATHPGEEAVIRNAALRLRDRFPALLTIVVPRHPPRGAEVSAILDNAPQRSLGEIPSAADFFWVADTLGELGLFYRLCPVAFVGNSLEVAPSGGGHNPYEPARLGSAVISGLRIDNFKDAFAALGDAAILTRDDSLADSVAGLLADPSAASAMGARARERAGGNDATIASLVSRVDTMTREYGA
jgi:3-deoxy-D-manno-octulosonic-acid transferase